MGFAKSPIGRYREVNTFADLPPASTKKGVVYLVKNAIGTILINRKRTGLYLSDGITWVKLG